MNEENRYESHGYNFGTYAVADELYASLGFNQSKVDLAKIAAPFAAAGKSNRDAICAAWNLLVDVDQFLVAKEIADRDVYIAPKRHRGIKLREDLNYLKVKLGVASLKSVKKYLLDSEGQREGCEIWKRLVDGEMELTPEIIERMKRVKLEAITKRNRANARKRKKR